jgi:hypothetical protein
MAGGKRAQARYLGHEKRCGLILHDLEVEGSSFCKLIVKETIDGEWETPTRFGQYMATVRVAFREAPVLVKAPTAMGGPPPSNNSMQEVLDWRINDGSSSGNGD